MERESQRGRGETRRAGNTSRGSTSNASSLSRSNARSRSRSRSVDSYRRSGRSVDNDRRSGISSNHQIDDSDVRPLSASSSNPATVTQQNYITSNVAAATDNARTEAVAAVPWGPTIRFRPRREEFSWERRDGFYFVPMTITPAVRFRQRREPAVPMTAIPRQRIEPAVPITITPITREEFTVVQRRERREQADRAAVQQLPRVIISEQHIDDDNKSMCSICLEQYKVGEEARVMPCGHMYHETCIFRWLERQHTCPFCRFKMPIQSSKRVRQNE